MSNDAYEHMKMLLNVNKNAKIVIECELRGNVRFLALMNASSRYWSSIHANECVFSRNEQQKVYNTQKTKNRRANLSLHRLVAKLHTQLLRKKLNFQAFVDTSWTILNWKPSILLKYICSVLLLFLI